MEDYLSEKELCYLCKTSLTTLHAEISPGQHIFVCEKSLETAEQNFIWVCMHCGNVFIRYKSLVLSRLQDPKLMNTARICRSSRGQTGASNAMRKGSGSSLQRNIPQNTADTADVPLLNL
jgi:hypothetical protein